MDAHRRFDFRFFRNSEALFRVFRVPDVLRMVSNQQISSSNIFKMKKIHFLDRKGANDSEKIAKCNDLQGLMHMHGVVRVKCQGHKLMAASLGGDHRA